MFVSRVHQPLANTPRVNIAAFSAGQIGFRRRCGKESATVLTSRSNENFSSRKEKEEDLNPPVGSKTRGFIIINYRIGGRKEDGKRVSFFLRLFPPLNNLFPVKRNSRWREPVFISGVEMPGAAFGNAINPFRHARHIL